MLLDFFFFFNAHKSVPKKKKKSLNHDHDLWFLHLTNANLLVTINTCSTSLTLPCKS